MTMRYTNRRILYYFTLKLFVTRRLKNNAGRITKLDMNQFILGSKGQTSRSLVTKTVPTWVIALL